MATTVYHEGELYVQDQTGESLPAQQNAGMIADNIPGGAAMFVQKQPFFFAASKDDDGKIWASVLAGHEGFISLVDPHVLSLNTALVKSDPEDLFWKNMKADAGVGFIFIELTTRRRLRVNGRLRKNQNQWNIVIEQAYANCPKYIQRREMVSIENDAPKVTDPDIRKWVSDADTIFVGSSDENDNLDMSHRGGMPGFIEWKADNILRIPEYSGNSIFNTLGNFHVNPLAGILFVDFLTGDTLQMTGKANIYLNQPNNEGFTGGTNRYWEFTIEQTIFKKSLYNFSTHFIDYSPHNP